MPDEPFSHEGVAPASAEERAALAAFLGALEPGTNWFDASDPGVVAAWQAYAATVGVYRGVHLVRTGGAFADEDLQGRRVGSSACRDTSPSSVSRGRPRPCSVEGRPIQDDLRYSPAALAAGDWLTDFPDAIGAGMGVKVTDASRVAAALDARWVIAVGIRDGEATEVAESYLRDAIANGNVELLEQDSPTNNSENARTRYDPVPRDPVAAVAGDVRGAAQRVRPDDGRTRARDRAGRGRRNGAAGCGRGQRRGGRGSSHGDGSPARAGGHPVLVAVRARLARDDLIDFLVDHAAARGPLPAVRLDMHPFGVLPIVQAGHVDAPDEMSERNGAPSSSSTRWARPGGRPAGGGRPAAGDRTRRRRQLRETRADPAAERGGQAHRCLRRRRPGPEAAGDPLSARGGPRARSADYIGHIQTMPLADLPDPDQTDMSAPLLFRLLRLTVERTAARLPRSLRDLPLARMVEAAPPPPSPG